MKKCVIYFFAPLLILSCNRGTDNPTKNIRVYVPDSPTSGETILAREIGNYTNIFTPSDYAVGIASVKDNPRFPECIYAFEGPNASTQSEATKSGILKNKYAVSINGQDLFSNPVKSNTNTNIQDLFGKKLQFKFTPINRSRALSNASPVCVEINAPELLEITNPCYDELDELYPLCDYKSFVVEWVKDINNSNGVVVLVMWAGTMMFGESYDNILIRNIDCVPDNGRAVLSETMFEGIPDTALCFLVLLRGDIKTITLDDIVYQMSAKTQVTLPFVLVREII